MPKSPNEIELSKEIKLLIIGVILGALASGIVTYTITWTLSHDEYVTEQQKIANALYIDVSNVEDKFNRSMNDLPLYYNNSSELVTSGPKVHNPGGLKVHTSTSFASNPKGCSDVAGRRVPHVKRSLQTGIEHQRDCPSNGLQSQDRKQIRES